MAAALVWLVFIHEIKLSIVVQYPLDLSGCFVVALAPAANIINIIDRIVSKNYANSGYDIYLNYAMRQMKERL